VKPLLLALTFLFCYALMVLGGGSLEATFEEAARRREGEG
jgi:hypothetical protein